MRKVRPYSTVDYGSYPQKLAKAPGSGPNNVASDVNQEWIFNQLRGLQSSTMTKSFSDTAIVGTEVFESTQHRKPTFNSCFHKYGRSCNFLCSVWWLAYGSTRPEWSRQWRFPTPSGSYSLADAPDFSAITSNMQAEAYHTMLPRFEGDISMANFIFEMKDFRDLSDLISTKTFEWMRSVKTLPKWKHRFHESKLLSDATKRTAELHLTNNFVIDPLAQDLSSLVMQAQRLVMDVQEDFRRKGLQPEARHFSKQLNQTQSLSQAGGLGSYEHFHIDKGFKSSSTFTATMEGHYGYKIRGNLDAFMKYWGLHFTAEAVWNALPFSFLADYFLSIGHSLNVMRHDKNVSYHVDQYCESILNSRSTGIFIRAGSRDHMRRAIIVDKTPTEVGNDRSKSLFANGIRSTNYCRRIVAPYWGPFLPRWKIPSGKQALNMAAILRCLL